jgi:hypothetical protein
MTAAPPPVAQLDETVVRAIRSVHRARWIFLLAVVAAMAAAVGMLGWQDWQQHRQLHASCQFWSLLAPLPITVVPPARRPSELGVLLVADSRDAFAGQQCGTLPPAAPSLLHWAAYYGVPLP